jgi:hypothetical protein
MSLKYTAPNGCPGYFSHKPSIPCQIFHYLTLRTGVNGDEIMRFPIGSTLTWKQKAKKSKT